MDPMSVLTERKEGLASKLMTPGLSPRVRAHVFLVEIPQVESAMLRVSEGTYGLCVDCGEPVGPERLKAIPEVAHCIGCRPPRGSRKE